jgi:glycine cleavage system H protein
MVPILVLFTFAAFIGVGWLLFHRRHATAEGPASERALHVVPALAPAARPEQAFYLHPGHVWVSLTSDGLASVGASDFAANFVGSLSQVKLPEEGMRLRQGEPAWTLVSAKQRELTQVMPVDGEIVAVNRDLVRHPDLLQQSPRDAGWILRIRPTRLRESLQGLFTGPLAETWKEVAGMRLNAMLSPALGRLANDGGVWLSNFGDMIDESMWLDMRRELFPPQDGAATTHAAGRN